MVLAFAKRANLMHLSAAIQGYWLARKRDLSPDTVTDYRRSFRHLVEYLNDPLFAEIKADDIHAFLNYWSDRLSNKSVANIWIALSSLWSWAETEPALRTPHIIRGAVRQPKYTSPPVIPFTQEEIKRMLAATTHTDSRASRSGGLYKSKRTTAPRDQAIVFTLLDSGMRNAELCDLCIGDYNQDRGELRIHRGKGDKGRVVYVGQRTRRALWRYLAGREDPLPTQALFVTRTNRHIDPNALYRMLLNTGERAGVQDVYQTVNRRTSGDQLCHTGSPATSGALFIDDR